MQENQTQRLRLERHRFCTDHRVEVFDLDCKIGSNPWLQKTATIYARTQAARWLLLEGRKKLMTSSSADGAAWAAATLLILLLVLGLLYFGGAFANGT